VAFEQVLFLLFIEQGKQVFQAGEAKARMPAVRGENSGLKQAFGLEAAQFGGGAAYGVGGLRAGAFDGYLCTGRIARDFPRSVGEGGKHRFHDGAAAEAPCSAQDFHGEHFLHGPDRFQFLEEALGEGGVAGFFVRLDGVLGGKKSEPLCIAGGTQFPAFGAWAG
jgi:hypothetical protein